MELPDEANVLLLAPAFEPGERHACASLLAPKPTALLGVTLTRTPDQWLPEYEERLSGLPDRVAIVDVGERPRSTSSSGAIEGANANVTVSTVPNPGNLTDLGVTLTEELETIAGHQNAAMCFESAGTLHQYAEGKTVYQFFRVLTDLVAAHGMRAHYHVDPDAIDEQAKNRLLLLFDAVVQTTDDGDFSVRTR